MRGVTKRFPGVTALDDVRLDLNGLASSHCWAIGKVKAYSLMREPFVHLDHDVFLKQPLPDRILNAPRIAQHTETFDVAGRLYCRSCWSGVDYIYPTREFLRLCDWLPLEWTKALSDPTGYAYNAGILGGNDLDGLLRYATNALAIYDRNPRLATLNGTHYSVMLEQFGFRAEFERQVETLIHDGPQRQQSEYANSIGYCHLIGQWKRDPAMRKLVTRRMADFFPTQLEKIERRAQDSARSSDQANREAH